MSQNASKRRISFQTKVLVPLVALMVLLIATTMWLVNHKLTVRIEKEAAEKLDLASDRVKSTQQKQGAALLLLYQNVVNEPRFRAVAKKGDANTGDDFLKKMLQELTAQGGASIASLTFANSRDFASTSEITGLSGAEFQSRSAGVIAKANAGKPVVDTIIAGGHLLDIVSLPIMLDGEIFGIATFGEEIGPETAREIKDDTHAEIFFMLGDQVVAGSLPKVELYPELLARFGQLSSGNGLLPIVVDHDSYLCRADSFTLPGGTGKLDYLLLFSDVAGRALQRDLQKTLLALGLLGIALGTAVTWVLVTKITQPLRKLRDSVEAVGHGDFSRRVEVNSNDECGELAAAFNHMTENLQTSRRELEQTVETLKTTQHQLIQSEKLAGIGEFVSGVAHELNNPLTSVMGFAELMQQGEIPEPQRRFLDMIAKSAKRCTKIVQSLLSFARRHAPERKVVSVNEIVESAVEILQYQMRTGNIEVISRLDPELPPTLVDPHQMQQVFLNLINNAKQAMEARQKGGWLRITTETGNGRVRVIFQDNGPGITAENLKRVFNPFFTTKEVGKGTGLGLSLCYGIVTEHGGSITPHSKPGEGATFIIELPITREDAVQPEVAAVAAPADSAHEGAGKRVLVVDDEDSILTMIQEALTVHGYKVDVVRDGEAALRRFSQYEYDLALCDWKMPGLSGQEVYERLRASNPEMSRRLIFITGDVANEQTQKFLESTDKVCLTKPFTLAEFRAAISRMLSAAAGTKA